jgi:hypothetical protein
MNFQILGTVCIALDPAGHLALEASNEADWQSNCTAGILHRR